MLRVLPLATLVVLAATNATAKIDPAAKCLSSRLIAAGKATRSLIGCQATAAKKGRAAADACVEKARAQFVKKHAKADKRGGCLADDGATAIAGLLVDVGHGAATDLLPPDRSACQAAKLRAAGSRTLASLQAHARHVRRPKVDKLVAAFAKLRSKFTSKFEKAERKSDCTTTADAATAGANVDAFLDAVMGGLKLVAASKTVVPSAAQPARTPGSPGVAVTNQKLLTQFGGADIDLNNATYTRWRLAQPEQQPDAIVILMAGFGGGANNFEVLVENLIPRALEDAGLVLEVWGHDRRGEQLEDREGVLIAARELDAQIALDWLFGNELGLALHPELAAGPNRRAVFYNTTDDVPFIANWTSHVLSLDVDAVVEAARAVTPNVFLGGHSAGTDFTARYAATDLNTSGSGPADPGYAKLRGLVMFEGTAGSTGQTFTDDALDRMIAKFDGGLFGAVRDGEARCVDGTTPCTIATEAVDCGGQSPPVCTESVRAHAVVQIGGLDISPRVLATAEPAGVQGLTDPDGGQAILQVDQDAPGNNAIAKVPDLLVLGVITPATVEGLFGQFLDDDGLTATVSPASAASMGAPGPIVDGLATWLDIRERASFPPCPGPGCVTPDNGLMPTTLPGGMWGLEKEVMRIDRFRSSFAGIDGVNASDWYYPTSGLSVTSSPGVCDTGTGTCTVGAVGDECTDDGDCAQSVSLDSTALSIGRGRPDIVNLTQAGAIDVPVLCIGGSNGLTATGSRFVPYAESLGPCAAASCDGATPRLVDATMPNEAFPTFGDAAGGFEVVIAEGFSHIDVVGAEDNADNPLTAALIDFVRRNIE